MSMEKGMYSASLIKINGIPVGFDLGFYGCHEHESGIPGISGDFGINFGTPITSFGQEKMTRLPSGLYFGAVGNDRYAIYDPSVDRQFDPACRPNYWRQATFDERNKNLDSLLENHFDMGSSPFSAMTTAWDKDSFGLRVRGPEFIEMLDALEKAFLENDVVFDRASTLSSRFGLIVLSRLPTETLQGFKQRNY